MKLSRRRNGLIPKIDPTPMVDTMFQVLLFFMISSSFMMQPGIRVKLPSAVTAESQLGKHVFVTINESYQIFLNEEPMRLKDLENRFREIFEKDKEVLLIVKADKSVSHGFVVEIMDIAKSAGADKIAIATEPTVKEKY